MKIPATLTTHTNRCDIKYDVRVLDYASSSSLSKFLPFLSTPDNKFYDVNCLVPLVILFIEIYKDGITYLIFTLDI